MPNNEIISRGAGRLGGRLIALPSRGNIRQEALSAVPFENRATAIDFPAMPDTLDLVRGADYAISYNPFLPDGLHVYKGTRPMEIPFSFKLHAFDNTFCREGALTLLKLAARLHAFVLPISAQRSTPVQITPGAPPTAAGPNAQTGGNNPTIGRVGDDQLQAAASDASVRSVVTAQNAAFYPPVTAWLHLIYIGQNQPGVSCIGYVKEVSVKLHGPWMRGPKNSFNLPTMGEYSFTFVHRPGHTNNMPQTDTGIAYSIGQQVSAAADDVKDTLYNTWNLAYIADYRGFSDQEGK